MGKHENVDKVMQTPPVAQSRDLLSRLSALQSWAHERGIRQYAAFFKGACAGMTAEQETRMRFVWTGHRPVSEADAAWISQCENVVTVLKAA